MLRSLPLDEMTARRRMFPPTITSPKHFDLMVNTGILDTFAPPQAFITPTTPIVTMGSCFAQNIARILGAKSYAVHRFDIQERLFTPFALRNFLKGLQSEDGDFSLFEQNWNLAPDQIVATRAKLAQGGVVIITLGLSVAWFDLTTGEMILDPGRKVGRQILYDHPERYQMRPTRVADNIAAIDGMVAAVRALNPKNRIVLTLSPIPLVSAPGDYPVVVADTISKSILRAALFDIFDRRDPELFYFPSFEILKWLAPMVDQIWYEDDLLTHIRNEWIDYTIGKFMQVYCVGAGPPRVPTLTNSQNGQFVAPAPAP